MPSPPSRRAFLAASAGAIAALGGCANAGTTARTEPRPPTDTTVPTPPDGDRPTQTPRDPRPVDVAGAWPQPGYGPGHAGVSPATGVPADGELHWKLKRIRSGTPVLADGRLFHYAKLGADPSETPTVTRTRASPRGTAHPVYGEPALFARDAADGRRLWTVPLEIRYPAPAVVDDLVIATGDGFVTAHRVADGEEAWGVDLGARVPRSPTVADGTVLVPTGPPGPGDDADVRAYRIRDGRRLWIQSSPMGRGHVAVGGDVVVVLSADFQVGSVLTGRSLADGSQAWRVELDHGLPGGPVVAGDAVYVAPDDAGVLSFALDDGSERWTAPARTPNRVGVAADADTAYLVDDVRLRALDAADGAERWSVSPEADRAYASVPALGTDAIYLEKRGFPAEFVALSRTDGDGRWSFTLPEQVVEGDMVMSGLASQPVVADGAVYAYAVDGLYAFGPAT